MVPYEKLLEKEQMYVNTKVQLESYDVDAEVERRLTDERAKIKAQVIAERDADILKCNHYLDLINILKSEAVLCENETPSTDTIYEQENNIVESTESEVNYVN